MTVCRGVSSILQHGEFTRQPTSGGQVFFSSPGIGSSRVIALSPSVRFVLQGEQVHNVDGRIRRVRAGEFVLVEAGTLTDIRIAAKDTLGLCIYLPSTPRGLIGDNLASAALQGDRNHGLARRLAGILSEGLDGGEIDPGRVISIAMTGAERFLGELSNLQGRLGHRRPAVRAEILHRLERARAFIHARADSSICLDDICREAALSRFYLSRMFADVYGMPPLSYHRRLRLDGAAAQLAKGASAPSELAEELGYGSISAFSRAFRAQFGIPPGRYAKSGSRGFAR